MPDESLSPQRQAFADNVRTAREKAGLTQEQLAWAAGLHQTEIARIESGQRKSGTRHGVQGGAGTRGAAGDRELHGMLVHGLLEHGSLQLVGVSSRGAADRSQIIFIGAYRRVAGRATVGLRGRVAKGVHPRHVRSALTPGVCVPPVPRTGRRRLGIRRTSQARWRR